MKRILALAVVIALGAGAAQAKKAYCQDPTTHKRISCKTVPAAASTPTKPVAATKPTAPAYPAPAKRPSIFSGMMKPKVAPSGPMQSPAPAGFVGNNGSALSRTGGAPNCKKGKVCGHSCIAMDKVCHKPS